MLQPYPEKEIMSVSYTVKDTFQKTVQYDQGDVEANIQFYIVGFNLPKNTLVSFECDNTDTKPQIVLPPTPATNTSSFLAGLMTLVPENFSAGITFKVEFPKGVKPDPDAVIQFVASYILPPQD